MTSGYFEVEPPTRVDEGVPEWWPSKDPYIIGDCIDGMRALPSGVVDLIVTDPPFTFGMGSSIVETKLDNWNDLLNGSYFFKEVIREANRILKNTGAMWIFNSWRSFPCIMKAVCEAGLKIESVLIWDKDWIGPGGNKGLRPSYEIVVLICKESFAIPNRGIRDIQRFPWSSSKPNHPAEKPLDLVKFLIKISGDHQYVFDPFLGSGTTIKAANELGRVGLGFEINANHEPTIRRRALLDIATFEARGAGP